MLGANPLQYVQGNVYNFKNKVWDKKERYFSYDGNTDFDKMTCGTQVAFRIEFLDNL
jgi:hypothetical protein